MNKKLKVNKKLKNETAGLPKELLETSEQFRKRTATEILAKTPVTSPDRIQAEIIAGLILSVNDPKPEPKP